MDDITNICSNLGLIKAALMHIFSEPLAEDKCKVLISCFLDELILHSDKTQDVSCVVDKIQMFLEKKVVPCLMKEGMLNGNRMVFGEGVTMLDESNSPF